jgi:hypothetical protein
MTKTFRLTGLLIVMVLLYTSLFACSINTHSKNVNREMLAFAPQTKSMTYNPIQKNEELSLTFYCDSKCFIHEESEIKAVRIVNKNTVISAKIKSIEINDEPITSISDVDIFLGSLLLSFETQQVELLDAYLEFEYSDNEKIKRYIGDISFLLQWKESAENEPEYAIISGGVSGSAKEDQDLIHLTGIILQSHADTELVVTDVDFGISTIGVDRDNIRVFSDNEYNSQIAPAITDHKLDTIIPNAYDIPVGEIATECMFNVPKGETWIYLPFKIKDKSAPPIFLIPVKLIYKSEGKEYETIISEVTLFTQFFHENTEIEQFFSGTSQ